jgi:tetratricopeptide (TPR) repeat protein
VAAPLKPVVSTPTRLRGRRLLFALALVAMTVLGLAVGGVHLWAEVELRAGREALARRDFAAASHHLARCRALWPGQAQPYLLGAQAARRAEDFDEAQRLLQAYVEHDGVKEAADLERLQMRAQRGALDPAGERLLHAYVASNSPDASAILEALIQGELDTLQLGPALEDIERYVEREPNVAQGYYWRGQVRDRLQMPYEAADDFKRAVACDDNHDEARQRLGEKLVEAGRPEDALPHFERLHRTRSDSARVVVGLARCHHNLGRLDEAARLLNATLARHPTDVPALTERAKVAAELGQEEEAEQLLQKAVEIQPFDRYATYALLLCQERRGKKQAAAGTRERLDRIKADSVRMQDDERKVVQFPHDPAPREEIGTILLRHGRDEEGIHWLESALKEDPGYRPAMKALADHFEKKGDRARAAHYRQPAQQTRQPASRDQEIPLR